MSLGSMADKYHHAKMTTVGLSEANSFFLNVGQRTQQQYREASQEVEPWFTPVQAPKLTVDEASDGTIEDVIKQLRIQDDQVSSHHLTSVIAGVPPHEIVTVRPEDFRPVLPAVIAPVSIHDFRDFLNTTRGRTERFLGKKKKDAAHLRVTNRINGNFFELSGGNSLDFREPLERWQEEGYLTPLEALQACYTTVPETFFNSKFDSITDTGDVLTLIDRSTEIHAMHQVYEMNGTEYDQEPPANFELEIIQMKDELGGHLSEHLDLVERCLFSQTTSKAETIFQTVNNLQSLQLMVASESLRVTGLRRHIANLRSVTTTGRAQVLSLHRKRANSAALLKTLEAIKTVSLARPAMDRLLRSGDYTGAFSVLEQALRTLDGELNGVVALRTLARQFREMKEVIGGEMADTFVRVANDRLDITTSATKSSRSSGINEEEINRIRINLAPLIRGMVRKGNMRDAVAKHRGRLLDLIKTTAKLVVDQTLESIEALKDVDTPQFVSFLRATFEGLGMILTRAEQVHVAVVACLKSEDHSLNPDEVKELTALSANVVSKVRESSQMVIIRLLKFREEQHAGLPTHEFRLVFDALQDFIATSGEPATDLKQAISKQCESLLNAMDEKNSTAMKFVLDAEPWEMLPSVPKEIQQIVVRIESGKISLADIQQDDAIKGTNAASSDGAASVSTDTLRRQLVVANRNLKVTSASMNMIKYMQDYIRLALLFPPLAYRAVTKAFDLLILYDARIRRLILGMEVKEKGRLATIGSKHLAMASQSLTCIYLLLRPLARVFEDAVPAKQQARVENDLLKRVEKTMKDHINSIGDTLVSLVANEIAKLGISIQRADWDSAGTKGLDTAQEYMIDFADKVNKLHAVLTGHLDKNSLEDVFQGVSPNGFEGVFPVINRRVPEFFQNVQPKTPAGQMRIRVDVSYLVSVLRRLKGQGAGPGSVLEDWVNTKYARTSYLSSNAAVPTQTAAVAAATMIPATGTTDNGAGVNE